MRTNECKPEIGEDFRDLVYRRPQGHGPIRGFVKAARHLIQETADASKLAVGLAIQGGDRWRQLMEGGSTQVLPALHPRRRSLVIEPSEFGVVQAHGHTVHAKLASRKRHGPASPLLGDVDGTD